MEREWSFKITNRNQSSHIQMSKLKFVLWSGLIWGKSTFSQHNFWNANLNLVCFYSIDSAWKSIMKLCCECVTRSLASSTHPSFCNGAEIYPHCLSPFPFCSNPPLWPSARRVNACGGFHPLEGRVDGPITACSCPWQTQAPPQKACSFIIYGLVTLSPSRAGP